MLIKCEPKYQFVIARCLDVLKVYSEFSAWEYAVDYSMKGIIFDDSAVDGYEYKKTWDKINALAVAQSIRIAKELNETAKLLKCSPDEVFEKTKELADAVNKKLEELEKLQG
jgi:hypothetical protein